MVTHIGTENIAKYLEQTGAQTFKVFLDTAKTPIYSSSSTDPITEFIEFSNSISGNSEDNIYRIATYKKPSARSNAERLISETYFSYNKSKDPGTSNVQSSAAGMGNINDVFALMSNMMKFVQPFATQKAENEVLKRELDSVEDSQENNISSVISAILPALLPKPGQVMAGIDTAEVQSPTLTTALEILAKNDPHLADDLMKLATLSEDNPVLFETLITQLRTL